MTYDEICDRLSAQFGSENNATIRAVVNEKQREMLAMSEYRGATATLAASTVAGVVQYALTDPNVESYRLLRVGTVMYRRVSTQTLWELQDAYSDVQLTGPGGVFAASYSDDGSTQYIELYPAPAAGQVIETLDYAWVADATYGAGTVLAIPLDLHSKLLSGCRSYLQREIEERPDLAPAEESDFQAGIAELRARKNRRVGGGASRVRVSVGGR
jgi:hypothetical protein